MNILSTFDSYVEQSTYVQTECSHTDGHSDNHVDMSPCYPHTDKHNDHHLDG